MAKKGSKKKIGKRILLAIAGLVLIAGITWALMALFKPDEATKLGLDEDAKQELQELKNKAEEGGADDKRNLAYFYEANNGGEQAADVYLAMVETTPSPELVDILELLRLCANQDETNDAAQEQCLTASKDKLVVQKNELPFMDAYWTALTFEKNNDNQTAKALYEVALAKYDEVEVKSFLDNAAAAPENKNIASKVALERHINALR